MNVNENRFDYGDDRLVILPGLLCDSRMFAAQVAAFDAVVIDGFYGAAARIEDMAAYALDGMPERCALLGHSMGGRVSVEVCRQAPGRVARLALANTGMHAVREGEAEARYRLRDLGREKGVEALVDAWLPPMIGPTRRHDPVLAGRLRSMAIDGGIRTFERQVAALLERPDPAAVLAALDCPAAVIAAGEDRWSPVEQHEAIAAAIPGATLHVLDGAGHMAPAEDPDGFNALLRQWLSRSFKRTTDNGSRKDQR